MTPEATTIHWHGLRLPSNMDGVNAPVPAGGTFEYRFTAQDVGTFWYHPHMRSEEQVRQGLYGAVVVEPAAPVANLPVPRQVILSDVLLDENGAFAAAPTDMATQMLGVEGNLILANGRVRPVLNVRAGERVRLQFINAAVARYFRLSLPGHTFWLLGEDGGALTEPLEVADLLLVPGQRADVAIAATSAPGTTLDLQALPYERGHGSGTGNALNVFQVRYSADAPTTSEPLPTTLGTVPTISAGPVARTIRLNETTSGGSTGGAHGGHGGGGAGDVQFTINGQQFPNVPLLTGQLMARERWEVVNESMMDHPFHLHGFFFQVVSVGGNAPGHLAWRDTVNIPANTTVVLTVDLDGFEGLWMYHCHILGHAERGMMGLLEVAR